MAPASFDGLRILSLESRRSSEMTKLIRTYGGEPFVVPAMREVSLESNRLALDFADRLIAGDFDLVIFLTGVGMRFLVNIVEEAGKRETFLKALKKTRVAARGPKPVAALKEFGIPIAVVAPEPNTWHEMVAALEEEFGEALTGFRVAVQEYGTSNPELLETLAEKSASVTKVPVYQWALPEDLRPLREAVLSVASGGVDVVLFTTSVQVIHLFQVAAQMESADELRTGLRSVVIASIGPTTTEALHQYGITPDFEPSHPKMGFLVNEAAQLAGKLVEEKKNNGARSLATREAGLLVAIPQAANGVTQPAESRLDNHAIAPIDFLHEITSRIASADSFHKVLGRIVDFVTTVIPCDSCFIYVLEGEKLTLRASKNPHADVVDHLGIKMGQGITGWVAEHREPVALASNASEDPRFKPFKNLPEDRFEAMLSTPILCASKVVGVINLQHRLSYQHTTNEVRLLSTIGYLVGAEVERARLENENAQLAGRLEARKAVERAKGILQRDMRVGEEEAYRMMQRESRQRRKSMLEIAEAILLGEEIRKGQTATEQKPASGN
ncbi:uroporphyrinogen-III synthase [Edaphobacter modestus]|uniref:Uroporphyrinogen-III synthase n=1 Tax=Edaphobacter modestus TaxID=388466 RepID=A0A4Q7YYX4_9BACT|nr:uroporphyrinogen-III synthase [Edaphobacter modestus]RZU42694.1 uroporphyrinogen-III synthase [Edaphobacter modestus]